MDVDDILFIDSLFKKKYFIDIVFHDNLSIVIVSFLKM